MGLDIRIPLGLMFTILGLLLAGFGFLTIAEAGWRWIESGEAAKLERTTLEQYRQHLALHIVPTVGSVKLAQLTTPMVRELEDRLRGSRSPAPRR